MYRQLSSIKIPILVIIITFSVTIKIKQQIGGRKNMTSLSDRNPSASRVVNKSAVGSSKSVVPQIFNEEKFFEEANIEAITIDSGFAKINVISSSISTINICFRGQSDVSGEAKFDAIVVDHELRISFIATSVCYDGEFSIELLVPEKLFKKFCIKSSSGNITLGKGVCAEHLEVKTRSGSLKTFATFASASLTTINGNLNLYTDAKDDLSADLSTQSGKIVAEFHHIGYIQLFIKTTDGSNITNHHRSETDGYTARVNIHTSKGDICIK